MHVLGFRANFGWDGVQQAGGNGESRRLLSEMLCTMTKSSVLFISCLG